MRGLLAPLSPCEEGSLLRISLGSYAAGAIASRHLRRLHQLNLIAWDGLQWLLTGIGRKRFNALSSSR